MFKKVCYLIKKDPLLLFSLSFWALIRFVFLKLFGRFGLSFYPEILTVLITKRCNFHCPGCSTGSPNYTKNFKKTAQELNTNDIKKIIDEVSFFKPSVYFNGGEPTLRYDLLELIRYVKQKRMICALTTNGSLLNKCLASQLVYSRLDFLSVSIDGPEEFHDKIRCFRGAFRKATEGIKEIINLKKNLGVDYPHVRIASIIYPNSIENSRFIISLANQLKVDELGFGLLMYYPRRIIKDQALFIRKKKTGGPDPIGYEIENKAKFKFSLKEFQDFVEFSKKEAKMPIYFAYQGSDFVRYFDPKIFPSKKSKCLTPWKTVLVVPNGDLEICQGFRFGSIFAGSIFKQWNNTLIRNFRKQRAKLPFPACFRCNEGQKLIFD